MSRSADRQRGARARTVTKPRAAQGPSLGSVTGQIVLVLQGGGALGAYQLGVYQALHEAGIEPHWVVGTSIGAINGALIAGNPPGARMDRLHAFWDRMGHRDDKSVAAVFAPLAAMLGSYGVLARGIPGFFEPNPAALLGWHARLGAERAAWYSTAPLRHTLNGLIDFEHLGSSPTRLTVGAVNAATGAMRYFDSRHERLQVEHIMASGALPPAFPAIRIEGEPYWDGGIYSNTPTEVVLEDNPRRDSLIFVVSLWNPRGSEPASLWEVAGRQKDIQYASRAASHILKQQQIHKLRHIIRELVRHIPPSAQKQPAVQELAAWGCGTTMHVVRLMVPRLQWEDHTKDIDFSSAAIEARWKAGLASARTAISAAPWMTEVDPRDGVLIHEIE